MYIYIIFTRTFLTHETMGMGKNEYIATGTENLSDKTKTIDDVVITQLTGDVHEQTTKSVDVELSHEAKSRIAGFLLRKKDFQKGLFKKIFYKLERAGIKIDERIASNLDFEKAQDEKYIEALIKLHAEGIQVGRFFSSAYPGYFEVLSLEKAKDGEYIQTLIKLKKNGISVEEIICRLDLERAKNRVYIDILIKLSRRVYIDATTLLLKLSLENAICAAKNREYFEDLVLESSHWGKYL